MKVLKEDRGARSLVQTCARLELGTETAIHVAATWSVFVKLSRLFTLLFLDVQGTDEGYHKQLH